MGAAGMLGIVEADTDELADGVDYIGPDRRGDGGQALNRSQSGERGPVGPGDHRVHGQGAAGGGQIHDAACGRSGQMGPAVDKDITEFHVENHSFI